MEITCSPQRTLAGNAAQLGAVLVVAARVAARAAAEVGMYALEIGLALVVEITCSPQRTLAGNAAQLGPRRIELSVS